MTAHPTVHALAGWRTPVLLALSLLATGLQAQTTAPAPQRPSPLQADAPVPPLRHTSPFARYKAHTEVEVGGVTLPANESIVMLLGAAKALARMRDAGVDWAGTLHLIFQPLWVALVLAVSAKARSNP